MLMANRSVQLIFHQFLYLELEPLLLVPLILQLKHILERLPYKSRIQNRGYSYRAMQRTLKKLRCHFTKQGLLNAIQAHD